jgi:hypothetical protein
MLDIEQKNHRATKVVVNNFWLIEAILHSDLKSSTPRLQLQPASIAFLENLATHLVGTGWEIHLFFFRVRNPFVILPSDPLGGEAGTRKPS